MEGGMIGTAFPWPHRVQEQSCIWIQTTYPHGEHKTLMHGTVDHQVNITDATTSMCLKQDPTASRVRLISSHIFAASQTCHQNNTQMLCMASSSNPSWPLRSLPRRNYSSGLQMPFTNWQPHNKQHQLKGCLWQKLRHKQHHFKG